MNPLNPWLLLAGLLAVLGAFGSGYAAGHHAASLACTAAQVSATRVEIKQAAQETQRREAVGAAAEVAQQQIRVVYRTIKEQADETLNSGEQTQTYSGGVAAAGCELAADGVQLWNDANAGVARTLPAQPDYRLPVAAARAVGQVNGLAGQPYRGDGVVRAMSQPVAPAGDLRQSTGVAR